MKRYCRFTNSIIYFYKNFSGGLFCPYEIECRMLNGKSTWIYRSKEFYYHDIIKTKDEVRQYLQEIKDYKEI